MLSSLEPCWFYFIGVEVNSILIFQRLSVLSCRVAAQRRVKYLLHLSRSFLVKKNCNLYYVRLLWYSSLFFQRSKDCNGTFDHHPELHFIAVPRIYAGFAMKLNAKTGVRRKTLMELKSFQQVRSQFQRSVNRK